MQIGLHITPLCLAGMQVVTELCLNAGETSRRSRRGPLVLLQCADSLTMQTPVKVADPGPQMQLQAVDR
jgi:hypothetical protein